MNSKDLLKRYYARLSRESFVKSLLWGLLVGFSVLLISALTFWLADVKMIWLCAVIFVVVSAVVTVVLYYKVFRPTIKSTASRVDALGLEERMLTMTEYEKENSFIAQKQREDAKQKLSEVNSKLLKFAISIPLIIAVAIVGVFGIGGTIVAALVEKPTPPPPQYTLTYTVNGGGRLVAKEDGVDVEKDEIKLYVDEGHDGSTIYAFADEGWAFVGWSDGVNTVYRTDRAIYKNHKISAQFIPLEALTDPDVDEFGLAGPRLPGNGGGDNRDDGGPSNFPPNPDDDGNGPGDGGGGGAGAGRDNPNSLYLDGQKYYGDDYDQGRNDAMDNINNNNDLTGDQKGAAGGYFDTIQP